MHPTRSILLVVMVLGVGACALWLWPPAGPAPAVSPAVIEKQDRTPVAFAVQPAPSGVVPNLPTETATNAYPVPLRPAVKTMVTASESYLARLQAVDQLPRDLDRAERQALYEYLLAPCAEDAQPHGLVLKNNLMLALCHQEPPPPELSEVLVQLFRDHQQNGVIRDYAVQHFTVFYERLAALPQTDQNRDDLTRLQAALWEASAETDNTIGGTALLGLSYLATQTHSLDPKAISNAALRTAQMTSASEWARSAALQACARLEVQEVVPVLRALAEQGQTTTLRLSAVGALGQVGSAADVGLLERILASTQERLKPAARLALRRIQKRAGQTPLASQ